NFLHTENLSDIADLQKNPEPSTGRRVFPIFSSTVYVGTDRHCAKQPAHDLDSLYKSVFEMTPVRSGSEWVGYEATQPQSIFWPPKDKGFEIHLNEAVSTSGAAIDQRTAWWCPWIHLFGYDLGLSLDRFYGVRRGLSDAGGVKEPTA